MRNFESIGFTATHGCEKANKGPYFFWKSGACDNALTINSWWHQNFIMEYEIIPILRIAEATKTGYVEIHPGECFDAQNINSETRRGRKMTEKSNCLMAKEQTDLMKYEGPRIIDLFGKKVKVLGIRRLTPTECARLQTIPDWYKWECSDSQAYRMLGNGWTVEVIKHFFSFLPYPKEFA
jgi:site-specific DNA-cytosine methylase